MTFAITLFTILQSFAISLGVGSSTLAIVNFFVAIADGKIDETERRMMGVVYVVLRIAMVAILATTGVLMALETLAGTAIFTNYLIAQLIVLAALYLNATLMTLHKMPSTFGPGIQAGSWYALGTLLALASLDLTDFSLVTFVMAYLTWLVLAVGIVNGVMSILKQLKAEKTAA